MEEMHFGRFYDVGEREFSEMREKVVTPEVAGMAHITQDEMVAGRYLKCVYVCLCIPALFCLAK